MPVVRYRDEFHARILNSQHTACYVCQQFIRELPFVYLVWPADYIYMHEACALKVLRELAADLNRRVINDTNTAPLPPPTIVDSD